LPALYQHFSVILAQLAELFILPGQNAVCVGRCVHVNRQIVTAAHRDL